MQMQDPAHFLDGKRILLNAVAGFYDKLTCGIVQMTAEIRHDTVTAAGYPPCLPVADDGMKGYMGGHFQFIQIVEHRIIGPEIIDTGPGPYFGKNAFFALEKC